MTEEFLAHLKSRGYADTTLAISRSWLERFQGCCSKPLKELRPKDLEVYHQRLHWEPGPSGRLYSQSTVNQAVGVLKAYFRWCIERGEIKTCPAAHIVTKRPPPKEKVVLEPAQVRAVLRVPNLGKMNGFRNRACLALILEHQASPGSISRLDLTHFQPDTGALLLHGRSRRIVALGAGVQADLERYLRLGRAGVAMAGETAFFVTRNGRRMCSQNAAQILKRYCRRAGVPVPSYIR